MGKKYREDEIISMCENVDDFSDFYRQNNVNYTSKTSDTKRINTEVISQWLLANNVLMKFSNEVVKVLRKQDSSYAIVDHIGCYYRMDKNTGAVEKSIKEKVLAISMFNQCNKPDDYCNKCLGESKSCPFCNYGLETLPPTPIEVVGLGSMVILDYEEPLREANSTKAGEIDLLAFDGEYLRILELKKTDSNETMLRCVLEGFTYLSQLKPDESINGKPIYRSFINAYKDKMIGYLKATREDLILSEDPLEWLCSNIKLTTNPLVALNGKQYRRWKDGLPSLKTLMHTLAPDDSVFPIFYTIDKPDNMKFCRDITFTI